MHHHRQAASRALAAEGSIRADVPNAERRKKLRREMLLLIIVDLMFILTDIKLSIEKEKNKNGVTFLELRR